jgi:hypothetical protein
MAMKNHLGCRAVAQGACCNKALTITTRSQRSAANPAPYVHSQGIALRDEDVVPNRLDDTSNESRISALRVELGTYRVPEFAVKVASGRPEYGVPSGTANRIVLEFQHI